jgi:hypothetical protein
VNLYVIVVLLINATTGEPEGEYSASKPMLLEDCAKALIDRGPVPVKDNTAQVTVCRKLKADVSI